MIRYILAGLIKKFKDAGINTLITQTHAETNNYPIIIITQSISEKLRNSTENDSYYIDNQDNTFSEYKDGGETVTELRVKLYDTSVENSLKVNSKLKQELRRQSLKLSLKNIEIDLTNSDKSLLFELNSVVDDVFEMEIFYDREESFTYTDSGKLVWCYVHIINVTYKELPILLDTVNVITLLPNIELTNK